MVSFPATRRLDTDPLPPGICASLSPLLRPQWQERITQTPHPARPMAEACRMTPKENAMTSPSLNASLLDATLAAEVLHLARAGGADFSELFVEDTLSTQLRLHQGELKDAGGG